MLMLVPIEKAKLSLNQRSLSSSGTQSKQRLPTGQRAEGKNCQGLSPHWSIYRTYYEAWGTLWKKRQTECKSRGWGGQIWNTLF